MRARTGESHMEDMEISLEEMDFAPPAPPLLLSQFAPATRWAFFSMPPAWFGDWHPAPARQIFFQLSGEIEGEVSDGSKRIFRTGDIFLLEDTDGKGHRSRNVGDEPVLMAVVQMPDPE